MNLGLIRLFAWALQGRRAYWEQPKRGKNVSGVMASSVILGACDGLSFEALVGHSPSVNLWSGACVVMDNCSIHKNDANRE